MKYYIKANRFLLENEQKEDSYLLVENGRFGSFFKDKPIDSEIVDWSSYTIAPGLFDTHIHGIKGHDIMDGTIKSIQGISKSLLPIGVTRFLPTTFTSCDTKLEQAIISIKEAVIHGLTGAKSEGIFLEGPYFTERYKGAQDSSHFRDPNYKEFQNWQELANNSIVKIAIAPEREGALDFIRLLRREGVFVSIAHSDANYHCCKKALEAGVNNFTHLFNGMSGLHHRDPGVVGAAFYDDNSFAELICDGHHLHSDIAKLALRLKGKKLVLITDSIRSEYPEKGKDLDEFSIIMKDGVAFTESGSLAGSTLKLINGVKNLVNWSGESLHKIWHLGSLSPAESVGKDKDLGSIHAGKIADFVVLTDDLEVKATFIEGEMRFLK